MPTGVCRLVGVNVTIRQLRAAAGTQDCRTMNAKRLHRRWQASLETRQADIRKLLRQKRPLTGPEVHDLRVALRRARVLAELGGKWTGKTAARKFRSEARTMLDGLNDVRDCDVTLDWLHTNGGSMALIRRLEGRRDRFWRAAKRRLNPAALGQLKPIATNKEAGKKLARRLDKQSTKVTADCLKKVRRAPDISIAELHELRRRVRHWRYLRELEIVPRQIRQDRRLKTLIEVQESLGTMQNSEVMLEQLKPLGRTKELEMLRTGLRAGFAHQHREALQLIKRLTSLG